MTSPINWPPSLMGAYVRKTHPDFVARMEANVMKNQTRPLDDHAIVSLREITKNTVRAISLLDVGPDQDGLVAPNAFSIAQAHFHPEAWFRALYADETPVGFAMLEDWSQVTDQQPELYKGEPYVSLWRFMLDARYQHCGYGSQAMRLLIAHAKTRPGVTTMLLSFVPKENNPEEFYQRFGFARTGEDDDGELIMSLKLV
ncbi:MAG: GNAT family N-acetyltransferase [Pseudomonadota bacterium]